MNEKQVARELVKVSHLLVSGENKWEKTPEGKGWRRDTGKKDDRGLKVYEYSKEKPEEAKTPAEKMPSKGFEKLKEKVTDSVKEVERQPNIIERWLTKRKQTQEMKKETRNIVDDVTLGKKKPEEVVEKLLKHEKGKATAQKAIKKNISWQEGVRFRYKKLGEKSGALADDMVEETKRRVMPPSHKSWILRESDKVRREQRSAEVEMKKCEDAISRLKSLHEAIENHGEKSESKAANARSTTMNDKQVARELVKLARELSGGAGDLGE